MYGETKRQETTHATKDVATRRLLQKEMRETIALHPTDYRLGGKDVLVLVFADQGHAIEFVSAAKMLLIQGRHGLQWFTISGCCFNIRVVVSSVWAQGKNYSKLRNCI